MRDVPDSSQYLTTSWYIENNAFRLPPTPKTRIVQDIMSTLYQKQVFTIEHRVFQQKQKHFNTKDTGVGFFHALPTPISKVLATPFASLLPFWLCKTKSPRKQKATKKRLALRARFLPKAPPQKPLTPGPEARNPRPESPSRRWASRSG